MKPTTFPQQTNVLAEDQPEYQPLPVMVHPGPHFAMTSCWELTDDDIEKLKETRRIYVTQLTFGRFLQPQLLSHDVPQYPAE